jgi:hypothetical protein
LNSKECFKYQGYGYIAYDCPNHTIVAITGKDIPAKKNLLNKSNQENEVTCAD